MSDTAVQYTLTLRCLPPVPGQPHEMDGVCPHKRLQRALAVLRRHFRLGCVLVRDQDEAPDLWRGWYQLAGQSWQRAPSCMAATPELCWQLLEEKVAELRSPSPLREDEREFNRLLPILLPRHRNSWVLIKNGQMQGGLYPTEDSALGAGYDLGIDEPFLVHKVTDCPRVLPAPRGWRDPLAGLKLAVLPRGVMP